MEVTDYLSLLADEINKENNTEFVCIDLSYDSIKFTEDNACYMLACLSGPICPSCGTRISPCWRPWKQDNLKIRVCNACGLKYNKGQFCYYCKKVINKKNDHSKSYQHVYICYRCGHCDHKECVDSSPTYPLNVYKCSLCNKSRYY